MGLYIFDKDGTLIQLRKNVFGIGRPVTEPGQQQAMDGVVETLARLRAEGHRLAIASNQRAISKGLISPERAEELMNEAAKLLGGIDLWRVCPFNEHAPQRIHGKANPYRLPNDCMKPKPGMLLEIKQALNAPREETTMVGDSWGDRRAAQNAGVSFIQAGEFFQNHS